MGKKQPTESGSSLQSPRAGWYQRTGVGKKTEKDPDEPGRSPLAGPTTNKLPTRGGNFPDGLEV